MKEGGALSGRGSRDFSLLLIVISFTTFASSMVSASPLPFLMKELSTSKEEFVFLIGLLASVASVAVIAANFAGAFLADRIGRKAAIALGSGILVPGLFAYVVAPNVFWVLALYFVQMFSVSVFQPAFMALVADLSGTSSRGKAFGRFNLFFIGSAVPAPFVGGVLADVLGLRFPFIVSALVALIGLLASLGLSKAHDKPPSSDEPAVRVEDEKIAMNFTTVLVLFGVISLLAGLATGLLNPLNRLYPIEQLKVNATQLGLIFSLGIALMTALVQIPGGVIADRYGRKPIMILSSLGAVFVVALAYTTSLAQFTLATAGTAGFGNIAGPAYQAWQMELVPCGRRAMFAGVINAISGVGMFFGPFISIWLYQSQPTVLIAFIVAAVPWIIQVPPMLKLKETKTRQTT